MLKSFVYLSVFALILTLSIVTIQDAHAATVTAAQSGNWDDPATWGGAVPLSSDDVIIPKGITVTIPIGLIVTVDLGSTVTVIRGDFILDDSGTLVVDGTHGTIDNYGTINNYGTLFKQGIFTNYGTINNNGTILNTSYIPGRIPLTNYGTINNNGTINSSAPLTNYGILTNNGTINNTINTIIHNAIGGKIYNNGIINNASIAYSGELFPHCLCFPGVINNDGIIYNNPGGIINNYSTINNSGFISNYGTIDNIGVNDTINNTGTITNICGGIYSGTAPTGNQVTNTICEPSAPTGLTATAISTSQINLSWTAPSSNGGSAITGYRIERESPRFAGFTTLITDTETDSTTYSDLSLFDDTEYNYRVSAINVAGAGFRSSSSSATTLQILILPPPVPGLTATAISTSQINLSWASISGGFATITGYKIERESPVGSGFTTLITDTETDSTTYSDLSLLPNTEYNYRVSAINIVGTGGPSNPASATTLPPPLPVNIVISNEFSCESSPISGVWDGINKCTVYSLTISSGDSVTISSGIILKNDISGNIVNYGTINNYGEIINNNIFTNHGTINNTGLFTNNRVICLGCAYNPLLTNDIDGTINNSGTFFNNLPFINDGTINNTGTINTQRTLTNNGTINNTGLFHIESSSIGSMDNNGIINNSGTINNEWSLTNNGTINNECGGIYSGNLPTVNPIVTIACVTNTSTQSSTGSGLVSFATGFGGFTTLTAIDESTLPLSGKPSGVSFPHGFFDWHITGLTNGQTVTVTMTFPSIVPAGTQYWKVHGGIWIDATSLLGSNDGLDNTVTLTITDGGFGDADGLVNGQISDPGTITIPPDVTPPEAYNQFDPITKNVLVYGIDDVDRNLGAIAPVITHDGKKEIRTYTIQDSTGNKLVLVEKVKNEGKEIKVNVQSIQYNGGTVTKVDAEKNFSWSLNKDGSIKELEQKMTVGKDDKQKVQAKYDSKKLQTKIESKNPKLKETLSGMVLLKMSTNNGSLVLSYN